MSFLKNIVWSLINILGVQLLALITNVILARILYPEVFGLLGMAMVFAGIVLVFQEAGLSSYIIYKDNITSKEAATSFWLNIIISIILSTMLFLTAKQISIFFNQPKVENILVYISIGLFFSSMGITSRALLTKEKKFKILTVVDVLSEIISSILAIYFAMKNQVLISISARLIVKPIVQSIILLIIKNKFIFNYPSKQAVYDIVPFSSKFLGSQLFVYLNNNIDYLLIGKLLGSRPLGVYTMAYQWSVLARLYISGSINKVAFPEISSNKHDIPRVQDLFIQLIRKLSYITFPICLGLIAISHEFVLAIYSEKWLAAVSVLQILLISGAITSIGTLGGAVINGLGQPQVEMKLNFFSLVSLIILILLCFPFGINVIALGILLRTIIFDGIKVYLVAKLINVSQKQYYKVLLPSAVSSIGMCIVIYITKQIISVSNPLIMLSILVIIGTLSYILLSFFLDKNNFKWYMKKIKKLISPFKKLTKYA
ncbi:lipopolysaccharide biosynthesis protein [Priestia aryabhattai]|uniref:lipopolysaccharide biosynthesis protein n=1 Tax=Priestia aryabhattai TaxID=412384 RepID=UPI002E1B9456|nr:lipopolysaccharide biosynthesis protein [Priestia aryabhattai]